MSRRCLPAALPADRVVVDSSDGSGGINELLSEFTLSGDELVDNLALSHEQLLERVVREREHRGSRR